jgi:regulatory protein
LRKNETSRLRSLRGHALACLARREHSRAELARKLAPHKQAEDDLEGLLDELERQGHLSDERFAEVYAHSRRERAGPIKIALELRAAGVSDELIRKAVAPLQPSELETARAVWGRKFGHSPVDLREKARQTRFLLSRGFSMEVIRQVMAGERP